MSNVGKSSLVRRVAAAAGALALGLAGLAGAALTANADGPTVPVTGVGNIKADTPTSLTINKYSGLEAPTFDNGALNDSIDKTTHKPLNGVQFKITPVTAKTVDKTDQPINLDTPEGWDLISGVQAKDVTEDGSVYKLGDAQTVTTAKVDGVDGVATAPLAHGLYLVQEVGDTGNNGIVSKTADFLVTLPLPQVKPDGTTDGHWIYDVNVYPKNQLLAGPVKTINSDADQSALGVKVGDVVEYTIKQTVPALNANESYTQARIFDNLKTDELKFDSSEALQLNGTDLVLDQPGVPGDYTLTTNAAGDVSWELTPAGLAKIHRDDVLSVVFKAKVLKVTVTGGIANGPGTGKPGEPGYGSEFNHKSVPPTQTPYTYWGQLQVTKVVKGNTSQKLAGAEFAVAELPATQNTCSPTAPAAADAVATGTSDDNGIVQWNSTPANPLGLFVANSDTDPDPSHFHKDYCLYETKAPAGYILPDATQKVTITPGTTLTAGANDITVEDEQQNHPNLPLTGAAGTVVMTLGGIALVAAGGAAYAISRKKQSAR